MGIVANDPGWYPDPEGGRQVRFWDGEAWTEYVQPFAPTVATLPGPESALLDYPYLEEADVARSDEPRTVSTWAPAALAPSVAAPGRRPPLWVVLSVVVLVAVVAVVASLLRSPSTPLVDPAPSGTSTADTPVQVGAPVTVSVPQTGTAEVEVVIEESGAYFVEAVSSGDVTAELFDSGGTSVWAGDDRRQDLADVVGGSWEDPGAFLDLAAGTYRMLVTERSGAAVQANVAVYQADVVDVVLGEPLQLTVPGGGYTVVRLTLDAETPLVLDVRADPAANADPRMVTFQSGGAITTDDRDPDVAAATGGSELDPYLAATFPAGVSFILLDDYYGDQVPLTLTVTAS